MLLTAVFPLIHILSAQAVAPVQMPANLNEATLAQTLWAKSPQLAQARADFGEGVSRRDRSRLLPNPSLSASWATIPLGDRNPPSTPFWDVPNYNAQLGTLIELGKRGPRQRAADAGLAAARLDLESVYRLTFFELMDSLAAQAEAVARFSVLQRLAADGAETLRLQRARAEKGDVAALEVDRLEVEQVRLISQAQEAAGARDSALATCAILLGEPCPRLTDEGAALAFLGRIAQSTPSNDVSQRPDLRALEQRSQEASAEETLARRTVIPDPTLAVGYQQDRFVAAGNQAHSLNVSVTIPLPVFDRGQVEAQAAARRKQAAETTREVLLVAGRESLARARSRAELLRQRADRLDREALPLARAVLERTEAAARRGGVALQDVLLARRALEELQLDRVEVAAERFRASLDVRRVAGPLPPPPGQAQ